MNPSETRTISITVNPSFWELFVASLTLIRYNGLHVCVHAVFPLAGLFILVFRSWTGRPFGAEHVLIALLTFSFTPLITALAVWSARRRNKTAQGPFTYTLDANGVQTSSAALAQTIRWAGILKSRRTKIFLFLFISPTRAIAITLKILKRCGVLEQAVAIVRQNTDFK